MKKIISVGLLATFIVNVAQASIDTAEQHSMEQVVIVGSTADAKAMAGSAFVIDSSEMEKFEYSDIHRLLRQVPGVYVQQEEGYGLRPNIGIRGAGGARSEKITLMEDGILISPAPYSGPSAYYFPTTGRMNSVEVLKGAETVKYGPYTVGGAVNLISTPIPAESSGFLQAEVGEGGEDRLHGWYGDSGDTVGWLLETYQHNADGFKNIDRSSRDAGLDKADYMAKLRINSGANSRYYNQLDIKLQYSSEVSNQSYLGLTDNDFNRNPDRRYGLSELDQMDNEHASITVSHLIAFSDSSSLKTTAYYNDFERDWYKLSGGSSYISAANAGSAAAIGILNGSVDEAGLNMKHNARQYQSYGLQSSLTMKMALANVLHEFDFGVRIHEDEVDRFQPTDVFDQINGSLVYQATQAPDASNNRVEEGDALSVYLMDHINVNERLDITAGIRFEAIDTEQYRYTDVERSAYTPTAFNHTEEVLLALGATYHLNNGWLLLAGVHQGFAPPSAGSEGVDPEQSINYEAGLRFSGSRLYAEAVYFLSDYENSVQYCTVANPCDDQTSGSISQGEATIKGLELLLNYELSQSPSYSVPLSFTYTYTDAETTTDSDDGNNLSGDRLMDIPEQQWAASVGFVAVSGWDMYLNASYTDQTCIDNTCDRDGVDNTYRQTDDLMVFDLSASYPVNDSARLYLKADNLFDERKIVSRKPDGARGNKPRTLYVGIKVDF